MGSTSSTNSSVSTLNSSTLSNQVTANQPITPTYNFSVSNTAPPSSSPAGLAGGILAPSLSPSSNSNIIYIVIIAVVLILILTFVFGKKL